MPAAEQFLWSNHTMAFCVKLIGGIVRRRACFPIGLLEIILISSSKGAEHTWCIVDPHHRNVTFLSHGGSVKIYQFCISLLTTTDFTMSRQIAVGESWPSMCIETHILSKQTVIQSYWRVLAYICWDREIQTDDVDGILHDSARV